MAACICASRWPPVQRAGGLFDRPARIGYRIDMFTRRKMRSGPFAWLMLTGIVIGGPLFGSAAEAAACHTHIDTIPQTIQAKERHCNKGGEHYCLHHKGKHSYPMKKGLANNCKPGAAICYISRFPGAASSELFKVSGPQNPYLLLPWIASVATGGKDKTDTPYEWNASTALTRPDPRPPSL